MTDEDRAALAASARLHNSCGQSYLGVADDSLSQQDHLEMALMFLDLADRALKHVIDKSAVAEGKATCNPG